MKPVGTLSRYLDNLSMTKPLKSFLKSMAERRRVSKIKTKMQSTELILRCF